jgi:hypothetical protein
MIAATLAICLGAPLLELMDSWDPALPAGNDTEADAAIVALCVGVAFAVAGAAIARIRALAFVSKRLLLMPFRNAPLEARFGLVPSNPGHSPPLPLRI